MDCGEQGPDWGAGVGGQIGAEGSRVRLGSRGSEGQIEGTGGVGARLGAEEWGPDWKGRGEGARLGGRGKWGSDWV